MLGRVVFAPHGATRERPVKGRLETVLLRGAYASVHVGDYIVYTTNVTPL